MNIIHEPLFDTKKIIDHYTEKDGVEINYVCTSALGHEEFAMDIFYRETPHPQFGNRYFGMYRNPHTGLLMITNADRIEDAEFGMIQDSEENFHYSAHRHDYKVVEGKMIDGGRAYVKTNVHTVGMRVKNGSFYAADIEGILDIHQLTSA
jgi:hypothetical protein